MVRSVLSALIVLTACAGPLAAQPAPAPNMSEPTPAPNTSEPAPPAAGAADPAPGVETPEPAPPPAAPRTMIGSWEFSNADRERICTITFQADPNKVGKRLAFNAGCAENFPFTREIVAWSQSGNDFLRLLDAAGHSVLEFSEVETGIFEAPKTGEGILFIQNPTDLGPAPKTADQIKGNWSVIRRTGKPICALSLSDTAAGEEFVVRVLPGCDPVVVRFAPATWQMDRGEIVLRSANGQSWRFEEGDNQRWQRIPQTANPLLMVRK
jgi:hypothetical protein